MLLTLCLFGATVVGLHALALARATMPERLAMLRLAGDAAARAPQDLASPLPASLHRALLGPGGAQIAGETLPRWIRGHIGDRPDGEWCAPRWSGPCFAVRHVDLPAGPGTLVIYLRPTLTFFAPLTVAFLVSVLLWLGASAAAGVLLLSALRRADEARSGLLAGLAHDLGTPLTCIRGFSETLLGNETLEPDARRGVQVVYREALRMQRLVEDMLALSRLEAGKLALVPRAFDLRLAVSEAGDRVRLAFGHAPAFELPDTPATVLADRDRIDQVLANLLDNAYRHGGGKQVRVTLAADGRLWRLVVHDSGPGLSSKALLGLFQPYHRGDGAAGGSGLGLAVSREVARRHGGELSLLNGPKAGCMAVLTLPAVDPGPEEP